MLFGCKQWVENLVQVGRIDADACILYGNMHTIGFVQGGFYLQDTLWHRTHRIDSIHDEIQDHLLQLNLIARY